MSIQCNGQIIVIGEQQKLSDLLLTYHITEDSAAVAVAVNDRVIMRSAWMITTIRPGDRIEILHAIQGG